MDTDNYTNWYHAPDRIISINQTNGDIPPDLNIFRNLRGISLQNISINGHIGYRINSLRFIALGFSGEAHVTINTHGCPALENIFISNKINLPVYELEGQHIEIIYKINSSIDIKVDGIPWYSYMCKMLQDVNFIKNNAIPHYDFQIPNDQKNMLLYIVDVPRERQIFPGNPFLCRPYFDDDLEKWRFVKLDFARHLTEVEQRNVITLDEAKVVYNGMKKYCDTMKHLYVTQLYHQNDINVFRNLEIYETDSKINGFNHDNVQLIITYNEEVSVIHAPKLKYIYFIEHHRLVIIPENERVVMDDTSILHHEVTYKKFNGKFFAKNLVDKIISDEYHDIVSMLPDK